MIKKLKLEFIKGITMSDLTPVQESILKQISKAKQNVKTDGYPMSIGELINLYKDGDVKLDPAFQRLFRWEDEQKTKLIESILIGIPIPEIFVAQKSDSTWHVVDGVQRLSTILQLTGVLNGYEPLVLGNCKYIPSLKGQSWNTLPNDVQRAFRRSKVNISIILTQNSDEAQYELFQRLNTGGSTLSSQEVRNCLILMISEEFFELINRLKEYESFKDCINLKEEDYDREEHMEMILRMFIGYQNAVDYDDYDNINKIVLSDFIDKETIRIIRQDNFANFENDFKLTFDKLKSCLAENSFKKYDQASDRFKGPFNISAFEMLTVGISSNINTVQQLGNAVLVDKIKELYLQQEVINAFSRGVRAIKRFKDVTAFARGYFN